MLSSAFYITTFCSFVEITDYSLRFHRLPDAAIDLIDEACVAVKIGNRESWEQLGALKRRKIAIEIDIRSLEVSSCHSQ
jgi:ATP-dependent Clp protease ATP-binding subunit ClpA